MEKITKKEFIETLCAHESALVLRAFNSNRNHLEEKESGIIAAEPDAEELTFRKVAKKQSNAIKFSDGAWLYFNQKGEHRYFKIGNCIFECTTSEYSGKVEYCFLGYFIKKDN